MWLILSKIQTTKVSNEYPFAVCSLSKLFVLCMLKASFSPGPKMKNCLFAASSCPAILAPATQKILLPQLKSKLVFLTIR